MKKSKSSFKFDNYDFAEYANEIAKYENKFCCLSDTKYVPSPIGINKFFDEDFTTTKEIHYDIMQDLDSIRDSIQQQCHDIIKDVIKEKFEQQDRVCRDYIRDKQGKRIPPKRLFGLWDKCIDSYTLFKSGLNKTQISKRLGLYDDDNKGGSVSLITTYLDYAEPLIKAASAMDGSFFKVAAIPLTESKTRKPREKKRNTPR